MRKKTHEEYVKELQIKNPNIEVIEKYIDNRTKIKHHCLIHDVYWNITPTGALSGRGCNICKREKSRHSQAMSQEDYKLAVKRCNPDISVIGTYINARTPLAHYCNKHNVLWYPKPETVLQGCGCKICGYEKTGDKKCKTREEYIQQLKEKNPFVELIGNYINGSTKTLHHCLIHDVYWNAVPSSILNGVGCKQCQTEKLRDSHIKTHEQYVQELLKKNPTVRVIGTYIGSKIKIQHYCVIHKIYWDTYPNNVLQGYGCELCWRERQNISLRLTQEEYIAKVHKISPHIDVIGEYYNMITPLEHKCNKHDVIWSTTPVNILQGAGCNLCTKEKLHNSKAKTHEQYVKELTMINPNLKVVGKYINSTTPILHECLIDNYVWNLRPGNALLGNGCPICNESHGERKIRLWLENNNIEYEPQKTFDECYDLGLLPFDFYIPSHNKCIEYDGEQHYKSVEYFGGEDGFALRRWHDNIKNQYCFDNNIPLLRIRNKDNIDEALNNFLFV